MAKRLWQIGPDCRAAARGMKRDDDDDDECAPIFGEILQHLDDRDRPEPVVDEISSWRTDGLYACLVSGVLSRVECEALVAATERRGYVPALLNKGRGREAYEPSFRRSDRRIVDDERLSRLIFARVRPYLEPYRDRWKLVGANERLRFLRYNPGDFFRLHGDGPYVRDSGPRRGDRSFVTLLLYLNDDYDGGRTTLYNSGDDYTEVVPAPGLVLIHDHQIMHEVPPLESGVKYVLRTDIMYERLDDEPDGAWETTWR